jgi:hypothetical protein
MVPELMTIPAFYWYPILWYVFATIVAFIAAIWFWEKGSSAIEGQVPELPIRWKLTGAGAIFAVVLLIFFIINPLKPLTDYKKIFIVYSSQNVPSPSTGVGVQYKIKPSQVSAEAVHFDTNTLQVQMIPVNFIYELFPTLDDNTFVTSNAVPKGKYKIRFISSEMGKTKEYLVEVK